MKCLPMYTLAALIFASVAFSADKAPLTKEEKATALVEKGMAFIKANGKEKAMAAFIDAQGKFIDGEFYIFAFTYDGMCLAHVNPKLVNKNQIEMVDADGKEIFKLFADIAKTKGKGWLDYKWPNPTTKKIQEKSSFIMNVDGADYYIGCGFYK